MWLDKWPFTVSADCCDVICRGFFSSASASKDLAKEGQEKAGNPYAPTDSAGGTPTDNKEGEGKPTQSMYIWCL